METRANSSYYHRLLAPKKRETGESSNAFSVRGLRSTGGNGLVNMTANTGPASADAPNNLFEFIIKNLQTLNSHDLSIRSRIYHRISYRVVEAEPINRNVFS